MKYLKENKVLSFTFTIETPCEKCNKALEKLNKHITDNKSGYFDGHGSAIESNKINYFIYVDANKIKDIKNFFTKIIKEFDIEEKVNFNKDNLHKANKIDKKYINFLENYKDRNNEQQKIKEKSIIKALNLNPPKAISRKGLIVQLIDKDGNKEDLVKAKNYDTLWNEAWEKLKESKNTILISAFPGTGKSYFFNNNKGLKILDSDSSTFDKKDFPNNYIEHIKSNIGKVDIICISSHEEVRKALVKNNLYFTLVYPDKSLKDEYIKRYKYRGSDKNFIKLIDKNWDKWLTDLDNQKGCNKIKLSKGEFLSDRIDEIKL